jgi:hypothetical protein
VLSRCLLSGGFHGGYGVDGIGGAVRDSTDDGAGGAVVTRYGVMTAVGRIIGATRYYGYFSPFEHELYNYNGPYYGDGDSLGCNRHRTM